MLEVQLTCKLALYVCAFAGDVLWSNSRGGKGVGGEGGQGQC